jgi:CheY-like chemotaxis protein
VEHRRILLIDDSKNDVELILAALRRLNVADRVDVCRDGAEGLDYLHRQGSYADRDPQPPGLVVLDIKMPRVGGLEVLRRIKSDAGLRSIPTVVLTSSREDQDILRSYEFGVNAYVVKPIDSGEFVDAVHGLGTFWVELNQAPPNP